MSTLLGLNFGSHRQAYFQVRITLHELTNVPMVAGDFKAKWRIDHTHNLSSALLASVAGPSAASASDERGSTLASDAKDKLLGHKKSSSTLASQNAVAGGQEVISANTDSASLHARDRDDASSTYSAGASSHSLPRKSAPRFLTGLREAFSSGKDGHPTNQPQQHPSQEGGGGGGEENAESVAEKWKRRESSTSSEPLLHRAAGTLSYEPRGETGASSVHDNKVIWDRQINAGVRIGIDKPRTTSTGTTDHTPRRSASYKGGTETAASRAVGAEGSGASTPQRDQPSTPVSASFGHLGQSELKVTIKAEVPTGTETGTAKSVVRMGSLTVNLSEFAPYPPHHHHHHHHHHHAHHHHHHHHHAHTHDHAKGGAAQQPLTRLETRKYLLQDGPTNATIKITVEMTHVGGSKEYTVPHNKRGLLVFSEGAGLAGSNSMANRSPKSSSSAGSEGSANSHEGAASTTSNNVSSSTAATAKALTDWHPHSVARHARIPDANLNTTLSHKDTARAVKEAGGGGRLAFSFAAGAHHDRPPEDVIDAIFSGEAPQNLLASPVPSEKQRAPLRGPASLKRRDMVKG